MWGRSSASLWGPLTPFIKKWSTSLHHHIAFKWGRRLSSHWALLTPGREYMEGLLPSLFCCLVKVEAQLLLDSVDPMVWQLVPLSNTLFHLLVLEDRRSAPLQVALLIIGVGKVVRPHPCSLIWSGWCLKWVEAQLAECPPSPLPGEEIRAPPASSWWAMKDQLPTQSYWCYPARGSATICFFWTGAGWWAPGSALRQYCVGGLGFWLTFLSNRGEMR